MSIADETYATASGDDECIDGWTASLQNRDMLADIAAAAKLIASVAPPPKEARPWCCADALHKNARVVFIEGTTTPFFMCEKHYAALLAACTRT